jgi:transcriptional regulator with XRE-family HTH domain
MVLDALSNLLNGEEPKPNKFTIEMGKLIQKAREEAGLSQEELAKVLYVRRPTISEIENGKSEISAGRLALLAGNLNKPISYFYPKWILRKITKEQLTPEEEEAVIQLRNCWNADVQKIAIAQIKALANLDLTQMLLDNIDFAKSEYDAHRELENYFKNRKNL